MTSDNSLKWFLYYNQWTNSVVSDILYLKLCANRIYEFAICNRRLLKIYLFNFRMHDVFYTLHSFMSKISAN